METKKPQADRLLKQLPLGERRLQEKLRKRILVDWQLGF
jgi:hypothetical protein